MFQKECWLWVVFTEMVLYHEGCQRFQFSGQRPCFRTNQAIKGHKDLTSVGFSKCLSWDQASPAHTFIFHSSPIWTVFRRLSARPPSLLLPRWRVSHPEPRPRWPCWAQAPPCWPGMEARTWRVVRTRPPPSAPPAYRMTLVGSAWKEQSRVPIWSFHS